MDKINSGVRNRLVAASFTGYYNKFEYTFGSYTTDRLVSAFGNNSTGYEFNDIREVTINDMESTLTGVASLNVRLRIVR